MGGSCQTPVGGGSLLGNLVQSWIPVLIGMHCPFHDRDKMKPHVYMSLKECRHRIAGVTHTHKLFPKRMEKNQMAKSLPRSERNSGRTRAMLSQGTNMRSLTMAQSELCPAGR